MKKYLSIILILLSFTCYSQALIENGHVKDDGEFVIDYSSNLKESFTWKLSSTDSIVNCFMIKKNKVIEVLMWNLNEVLEEKKALTFIVTATSGDKYIIDFLKEEKAVYIFNVTTLKFAVMTGEGVNYAQNLK
tara:strand:- start:4030 stop:4428 length:399 start_codon:yes stop_codon:yes gene_type:complete